MYKERYTAQSPPHLTTTTIKIMSRPSIAQFVDTFFTNALFQPDESLAQKALTLDLAEDAEIV